MRVYFAFLFVALLVVAPAAVRAGTDPLDAPPAGLVPAQVKLSMVLAKHDASTGVQPKTIVEDWTFTDTGLKGTEHLVRSGTDYHSIIHTDAALDEYGQSAGKRWHKDTTGFTTATTGTDETSFYAIRVSEDASDPKNDVSLAGETTGAKPAYVVRVTVSGSKHPEWIFYDATSSQIVRVERVSGKHRLATSFDDFRTTDGVTQAWHIHDFYWVPEFDDDYRLTSYAGGAPVSPTEFTQPVNMIAAGAPSRGTIQSEFDGGSIIVRLMVNGRGLDFELDPSVRDSSIDYDVAELNLPTFGKTTRLSTGEYVGYDSILPDAQLGPIHLTNMPIHVWNVAWRPSPSTKVVGTLGYDFLAANVIHVDYVHRIIEALPTALLAPKKAGPIPHQVDLNFTFDDGTLLVPMDIGDGFTDKVIFLPSWPFTMVFDTYHTAHASSFQDVNHKTTATIPFADGDTYGRDVEVGLSHVSSLAFANLNISGAAVLATNESGGSADAVLGYDVIWYYDIYYDYPHDRVLLVSNAHFAQLIAPPAKPAGA